MHDWRARAALLLLVLCGAAAGGADAQRVSIRSVDPATVELTPGGTAVRVRITGPYVETLTGGFVDVGGRPLREIRVSVRAVARGETAVSLQPASSLPAVSGTLVLDGPGGRVGVPGLRIVVAERRFEPVEIRAPGFDVRGVRFEPVTITAPGFTVRGLRFEPVTIAAPGFDVRGLRFEPVTITASGFDVRGLRFRPIELTAPTIAVRGNGGNQP